MTQIDDVAAPVNPVTPTEGVVPRQAGSRRRPVVHRTPRERLADGKARRREVPLDSHVEVGRSTAPSDALMLLREQDASRVPELVPIRWGRMLATPFTFYRGAARVMAADLADTPRSGLVTQVCGDAHLSNFGLFASPERRLVFDINDFDETLPGPWEWDVKRLAASLEVAGRDNNLTAKQRRAVVQAAVARYRVAMATFAGMSELDVWYAHADIEDFTPRIARELDPTRMKLLAKEFDKARTRDSMQALKKLSTVVDGSRRIIANPPLIVPVRDLLPEGETEDMHERFRTLIRQYRQTLQSDRRVLLERFRFVDMARKVVGVGSVGTRCWIVLMAGRDEGDPLFLQIKEAGRSVLEQFLAKSEQTNQGHRVIAGQRLMQQVSDIFLGWQRTTGIDGVQRDFYVRQLRDWKFSFPIEAMLPRGLRVYGEVCAWSLARAHARSGDRIAISGYLGSRDTFDVAIAEFATRYADLNERDHRALVEAVRSGEITAQVGL